jgi:ABC-type glycerol-3-phosphate transport system permease component
MTTTAFKYESEIYSELTWFPRSPTMGNFYDVIQSFRIHIYLRNTLIVATTATAIVIVVSTLAAYSLTRLRFGGRTVLARGVLFVYLIPGALLFIPMYLIIVRLRLLDTYTGLILANIAFGVPFCTWLMMGYLRSLSAEMEYAAMIDGCTRIQAMWYIVIPLSIPAIVTAGIFTFNNVWNEFIFALILTQKEAYRMISVGLANFYRTDYYMVGPMMAGSLIAAAPVVLLYILAQRFVVGGLAVGGVKG